MTAAIGFARSAEGVTCLRLTVTDAAPQAEALYRSLGFVTWGREPDVLRVDGTPIAERGMRLEFARPSAGDDPSGATADV